MPVFQHTFPQRSNRLLSIPLLLLLLLLLHRSVADTRLYGRLLSDSRRECREPECQDERPTYTSDFTNQTKAVSDVIVSKLGGPPMNINALGNLADFGECTTHVPSVVSSRCSRMSPICISGEGRSVRFSGCLVRAPGDDQRDVAWKGTKTYMPVQRGLRTGVRDCPRLELYEQAGAVVAAQTRVVWVK